MMHQVHKPEEAGRLRGDEPSCHSSDEIFEIAKKHPFYAAKLEGIPSFETCPALSKGELFAGVNALLQRGLLRETLYWSSSGGTTGSETKLLCPSDIAENLYQRAIFSGWLKRLAVIEPDTVALNLFGSTGLARACEIFNDYCERIGATVLPASADGRDKLVHHLIARFKPDLVMGGPVRLIVYALYADSKGYADSIENVLYGGQMLLPGQKDLLREVFQTDNFYSIFGAAESGIWGIHTPEMEEGTFLVPRSLLKLELDGCNAAGIGELLVTNLIRTRFPVLRYASGDMGRLEAADDAYLFHFSHRRAEELRLGGVTIIPADFADCTHDLLGYQLAALPSKIAGRHELLLRAVPPYEDTSLELLEAAMRARLKELGIDANLQVAAVRYGDLKKPSGSIKILRLVDQRGAQPAC